jgi:lactate dehydrogenase-like 2-hydroxyacid dehydrogenase
MNKKIFFTRKIPNIAFDMLTEHGFEVDVYPEDSVPTQGEIISCLQKKSYDGLVSLLTDSIDSKIFDIAPSVKIVANYATGFNNIDVKEAKKRGVIVTNTPGVSSLSVAEHAMALMLSLTSRVVEGDSLVRKGEFKGWSPMMLLGIDISGKTLGLIGVGNIGSQVARMAHFGFKAKIIYFDVQPNEAVEHDCVAKRCDSIEELLSQADIVSLHVPLLDSTHHLINETSLKFMKPTAFLVNTSRGPIVDESALVSALQNKVIAGAGLDVYEHEPELATGLSSLSNVVLTPHIASAREQTRNEMAKVVAINLIDFFDGRTPKNVVSGV